MLDPAAEQVAELFKSALDHEEGEWTAFLERACPDDFSLRAEVQSLLAHHRTQSPLLETPAIHLSAESFAGEETSRVGEVIGDYEILSLIGSGGMGEVYLARDRKLERKVALKLIAGFGGRSLIRQLHREERILAALSHPYIARLYGSALTADGAPCFIMEYIEGERLDDYCNRNCLTIPKRLDLFRKVCAAVAYAHQHLIIHRDLKPANIRVTPEGEPKLLDFGIAKLLDADGSQSIELTMTLAPVMTPDYASPEQVRGETMTTASDVYTLGVVLYELLTGAKPYRLTSRRQEEITRAITEQEPKRPSSVITDIPQSAFRNPHSLKGDLDNIMLKAIRKEPERRYVSVAQFSEDIRRSLEGLPVFARKDTWSYRASKFVSRNKAAMAAAALVFLAIMAGLTISVWQARIAARERDEARQETAKADQLNKFLQNILSAASPEQKGRDAKVIEVLDDAANSINTEFLRQPGVRAQALLTIGQTYLQLGLGDRAEQYLHNAFKLFSKLYGEENHLTAASMISLSEAMTVNSTGSDEAQKLVTRAIEIERKLAPGGSKELCLGLFILGEIEVRRSHYEKAEPLLQESLALSDKLGGEINEDSAFTLVSLGRAQQFSGDLKAGETTYRKSIAIFRKLPPRYELRMGMALLNLGDVLSRQDKDEEGITILGETNRIFEKQGETDYLFMSQRYLCKAYWKKEDYPPAIETGQKAIALGRKLHEESIPDFTYTLEYLAMSLSRTGQPKAAEPLAREAVARASSQFPKSDKRIAIAEGTLGECLCAQARFDEAERWILHSYESLNRESPPSASAAKEKSDYQPSEKWRTLARKRVVELYEKWQKENLAAKYRSEP